MRTSEALRLGVAPRTLYALRDANELRVLSRGCINWPAVMCPRIQNC
ncbi:MAG: type IV toxin-antitoxin system AbiEi family antitoxin domain-containing protein [Anaerolineae bacterium]|nr:type IV toxin-antitoxin system AbiEi family antitoxin domain-containing protein [Anaerolineae bacterium]